MILSDMPSIVVPEFQPAKAIGAGWVPFRYELDDFAGTGIATGAYSPADELQLDLGLSGWHVLRFCHTAPLRVWLDGEKGFRELPGAQPYDGITDFAIHAADLTDRRLHIAPKRGTDPRESILFYIRAEPCHGPRDGHRNLVATEDGHGVFWHGMDDIRDIYKWFAPYRDSDFFRMLWGVFGGGDVSGDPRSKTATVLPWASEHDFYPQHRIFNESIARVAAQGNILSTVVDAARDIGMELHFYFRVEGFAGLFPNKGHVTRYFAEHPEYYCRDEYGRPVLRLSYAFPEVQDHLLAYFDELMDYDPDGLCLAFNRGLPVMICEQPVIDAFRERHGREPTLPDEVDSEDMLAVRHELLAGFVERVNGMLSARGKAVSCIIPRNFHENRLRGLDIEMLLARGLLESVMVGAGHEDNPHYTRRTGQEPVNQDDIDPLTHLKALSDAKIFLGGSDGHGTFWPPNDPTCRAQRMQAILDAGLDGGYFWDANVWFPRDWESITQYGDRTFLDNFLHDRVPAVPLHDTRWLEGIVPDRYNPWNAC